MKAKLMFARFPYGHSEHDNVTDWMVRNVAIAKADPRIEKVLTFKQSNTPITMLRNLCMKTAGQQGVDFVCMIDNDMDADRYLKEDKNAKPFLETALDFMWKHRGPCCVGAPYAGPPPHEVPYILQWTNRQSDHPNPDVKLELMTREEVANRTGIESVAALPTGLILIDMRCLEAITPPYFDYEYADPPYNTEKATTEDIYFTRNLWMAGVPQYVLWDCWAGHFKPKNVGKPQLLHAEAVRETFRAAILRGPSDKKLAFADGDMIAPQPHEMIRPAHACAKPAPVHPDALPENCNFADLYQAVAQAAPQGARIVEVGCFLGASAIVMVRALRAAGKKAEFYCVDHFQGSAEQHHQHLAAAGGGSFRQYFVDNLRQHNISVGPNLYTPGVSVCQSDSVMASKQFADNSCDFVFIDADHSEDAVRADIEAWLPKIKPGGLLAGHDYEWPSVRRAVDLMLPAAKPISANCWQYVKPVPVYMGRIGVLPPAAETLPEGESRNGQGHVHAHEESPSGSGQ